MSLPALVPTNHVLTSGTNSALTWTNALTVNSVNYSTLAGSTISAARLQTSTLQTSTLQTSALSLSTIATSTIGVGTSNPQFALDVRGSAFVSSLVAPVDRIDQGAYLAPSAANSSIITAWIQKTVANNAPVAGTGPFWSQPATGSVYATATSAAGYFGGVLVPDGRVVMAPQNATTIGLFTPATNTLATASTTLSANSAAYAGSVLLPDGRVVFAPMNSTKIGLFNPATNTYSETAAMSPAPGNGAFYGGVLLPDGRVLFVPGNATSIGIFNPITNGYTTTGTTPGGYYFFGGVLLPDGRVIFVPNGTGIGLYLTNTPAPKNFCLHPCFNKL